MHFLELKAEKSEKCNLRAHVWAIGTKTTSNFLQECDGTLALSRWALLFNALQQPKRVKVPRKKNNTLTHRSRPWWSRDAREGNIDYSRCCFENGLTMTAERTVNGPTLHNYSAFEHFAYVARFSIFQDWRMLPREKRLCSIRSGGMKESGGSDEPLFE